MYGKKCGHVDQRFTQKGGFSSTLSPCAIIGEKNLQYPQGLHTEFGSYAQTHEDNQTKNSIREITLGYIYLCATSNDQGTY